MAASPVGAKTWTGSWATARPKTESAPSAVKGLNNAAQIAAGWGHSIACKTDGTVWSWGGNGTGALGDGTLTSRSAPVQVQNLEDISSVAAGHWHQFGVNQRWPRLGLGQQRLQPTWRRHRARPQHSCAVKDLNEVRGLACGNWHSIASKNDGTLWAWGNNTTGQLGDGTTTTRAAPVVVKDVKQ